MNKTNEDMETEKAVKDIMDLIATQVKVWISDCVEKADKYTKEMNEDYEHFFCWYSEDMLKVQQRLKIYRHLLKIVCAGNIDDVMKYMRHTVEQFTDDLLRGSIQGNSTKNSFNIAHLLGMEVKQQVVCEFNMMLAHIKK